MTPGQRHEDAARLCDSFGAQLFRYALMIDPFTGAPVRWKTSPSGYTIYSIGSDFRDDGGRTSPPAWKPGAPRQEERPDIGVEVALEPRI